MKKPHAFSVSLAAFLMGMLVTSCRQPEAEVPVSRFETDLFAAVTDRSAPASTLMMHKYPGFFPVFSEYLVGIGPPGNPNIERSLNQFVSDPVIREIFGLSQELYPDIRTEARIISRAVLAFHEQLGKPDDFQIITYVSGFNQAFVALENSLAIGLDHYLGSGCRFYKQLGLPEYQIEWKHDAQLAPDAVRAWITSEWEADLSGKNLLHHMLYEGIIHYTASEVLPKQMRNQLFRYTDEDWIWCETNESSAWTFLVDQELLFSTDQIMIRRMTGEAPFTRDFGNDSPPRVGTWIGYRIIAKLVDRKKISWSDLFHHFDAEAFLAESGYRP